MDLTFQAVGSIIIVIALLLIGGGLHFRRISSIRHFIIMIGRRYTGQDDKAAALEYLGFMRAIDCLRDGIGKTDRRPVFVMARQKLARERMSRVCFSLGALGAASGAGLFFIKI